MVDRAEIAELLDNLRFEEAERMINDSDPGLVAEVARRRDEAEDRARQLYEQILDLGSQQREAELAELAGRDSTRSLIGLLAEASRERADLYLREAERWVERRHEINLRRLHEARRALDGLDLELAKGLMNRVDGRYLSDEAAEERDELLLDISARTMELESLEEKSRGLLGARSPGAQRRTSWWRRWSGG